MKFINKMQLLIKIMIKYNKVKNKIIWTLTLIEEIERVSEHYLKHLEVLFSPNKIIISGGVCKKFVKYEQYLSTELEVVPAKLLNNAGIIGAAMTTFYMFRLYYLTFHGKFRGTKEQERSFQE